MFGRPRNAANGCVPTHLLDPGKLSVHFPLGSQGGAVAYLFTKTKPPISLLGTHCRFSPHQLPRLRQHPLRGPPGSLPAAR